MNFGTLPTHKLGHHAGYIELTPTVRDAGIAVLEFLHRDRRVQLRLALQVARHLVDRLGVALHALKRIECTVEQRCKLALVAQRRIDVGELGVDGTRKVAQALLDALAGA